MMIDFGVNNEHVLQNIVNYIGKQQTLTTTTTNHSSLMCHVAKRISIGSNHQTQTTIEFINSR